MRALLYILASLNLLALIVISQTPNAVCQALLNLPCDISRNW